MHSMDQGSSNRAPAHSSSEVWSILGLLLLFALSAMGLFMTIDAGGNWDFIIPFRGKKLLTMVIVGYCVAVSTVLFQTLTQNKILTPALMGFDSLYILIQTSLVFVLGVVRVNAIGPRWLFLIHIALMMLLAVALARWFITGLGRGLELMVLSGVVLGVLFRSVSSFMQRLIDPNEFMYLQDRFFATFNNPDEQLLLFSALIAGAASIVGLRNLHRFDALLLGRDVAINLGVDHKKVLKETIIVISVLVSVSTALVGPVLFFGLLVANLAYILVPTYRHLYVLIGAFLIAIISLIGGQVVLEHLFSLDTNLRVIIDFIGGILFIVMVVKRVDRL